MEPVQVATERGVMTATLVDVDRRNALGAAMIDGLREALAAANKDPEVRALVVTNEGSTFCAGANLKEKNAGGAKAAGSGGFETLLHEIQTSATPTIGRIAGHVVGGGNGLAAALDISIAADNVKFGFTEVRLGVAPAIISVVCLPKMRQGEAMEVFLRGHRFTSMRAAELGLINRAVPAQELDAAVAEVVADLRKGGPKALGVAKSLIYRVPQMDQAEAFRWAAQVSGDLFRGDEAREGVAAFIGKRPAAWALPDDESSD